jgi:ribonucleotide monophosphatase NagD (HAD superfamily)
MFRKLLQAAKIPAERALMIGDRLDTDVAVGRRAGVWTALVLTGVTKREEVARQPASERPDWIIDDLRGLRAILSSPLPPLRPRARGR